MTTSTSTGTRGASGPFNARPAEGSGTFLFGDETEWAGRLIVTDRWGYNHRCVYYYEEGTDDQTPAQPLYPPTYQADSTAQ